MSLEKELNELIVKVNNLENKFDEDDIFFKKYEEYKSKYLIEVDNTKVEDVTHMYKDLHDYLDGLLKQYKEIDKEVYDC